MKTVELDAETQAEFDRRLAEHPWAPLPAGTMAWELTRVNAVAAVLVRRVGGAVLAAGDAITRKLRRR